MRWRVLLPTALVVAVVGGFGVFFVVSALTVSRVDVAAQLGQQSAEATLSRIRERFDALRSEAARVAYTRGVDDALRGRSFVSVEPSLRALMTLGGLDVLLLLDADGDEALTLRDASGAVLASANASLELEAALTRLLAGSAAEAFVLRTPEDVFVVVGVPVVSDQRVLGAALVGQALRPFAQHINASSISDVAIYAPDGTLLASTQSAIGGATLPDTVRQQTLQGAALSFEWASAGEGYQAVALPLVMGRSTLGTVVALVPASWGAQGVDSRPWVAGLAALIAVSALAALVLGLQRSARRLETVAETAYAIASGHTHARTHMQPVDEIGRVGHAVDAMARVAQHREDHLRDMLTRERRERAYLMHVLESLPEGVILYSLSGQLLMMNDRARALIDGQPPALPLLEAANALDGFRLSAPRRIDHGARVLEAQTTQIVVPGGRALGHVVLLRDVTLEARRQRMHAVMLEQMNLPDDPHRQDTAMNPRLRMDPKVGEFVREVARHAAALQKMIVDMQALTQYNAPQARSRQRVMSVETLLWAVANDWRQIAVAANLTLQVTVQRKGLLIRGDERRLRLALGNIVDNAIKYTPAGGTITLEVEREAEGSVHLRVRDNGVGIHTEDLKHLFTPFYRGTPTDEDGQTLRVPGLGQGLKVARQIIEAHGGQIKVKSRAGAGTAVYVALPLVVDAPALLPDEPFLHEGDTVIISLPQAMRE
ncbi:ATP-binding protein [Aggregatilineales bacterium SYSU G02658]